MLDLPAVLLMSCDAVSTTRRAAGFPGAIFGRGLTAPVRSAKSILTITATGGLCLLSLRGSAVCEQFHPIDVA